MCRQRIVCVKVARYPARRLAERTPSSLTAGPSSNSPRDLHRAAPVAAATSAALGRRADAHLTPCASASSEGSGCTPHPAAPADIRRADDDVDIIDAIVNEDAATIRPKVAVQTEACVSDDPDRIVHAMRMLESASTFARRTSRAMAAHRCVASALARPSAGGTADHRRGIVRARRCRRDPDTCIGRIRRYQSLGAGEFVASMDFGQPQRDILQLDRAVRQPRDPAMSRARPGRAW